MIGFVVPFKSRQKSKDWSNDSRLLSDTLRSICGQKDDGFRVFVVYTDIPDNPYQHPRLKYIFFPYDFVDNAKLKAVEKLNDPASEFVVDERAFDQGKRVLFGCDVARQECDFIMSVDADDLVSDKIAGYVRNAATREAGWYVDKGFILKGKTKWLISVKAGMNNINGSTNIVNTQYIPKANFQSDSIHEFSFFSAHAYLQHRIRDTKGVSLKPLPFPAIIYRLHNNNWTGYKDVLEKNFFKTMLKYIFRGKLINKKLSDEFGL